MSFYSRLAGTQAGSSALFGGAMFAAMLATNSFADAAAAGALAATSWFAIAPLLKRLSRGKLA